MEYGITLNKIVDDLLNDKFGGVPSDDVDYSREQIMFKLFGWRATLARRDIHQNGLDQEYLQQLLCVEFKLEEKITCCNSETECYIMRSVKKLPQTITLKQGFSFIANSITDTKSIPVIAFNEVKHIQYDEQTKYEARIYQKPDNYLYLYGPDQTRKLNLYALLFDPREAVVFGDCDGKPCWTNDDPFPMKGSMLRVLYETVAKELGIIQHELKDKENDSQSK